MASRTLAFTAGFLALLAGSAIAQDLDTVPATPVLRDKVQVAADVVRIGDLVENAGQAAQIAVFRAPDLGTTGAVPVGQVMQALRAHQVIGVETRDIREVSVTRLARTLTSQDIETQIAKALAGRDGLGDAANIAVRLDRTVGPLQFEAGSGDLNPVALRYDRRSSRFDILFEIASDNATPFRLRLSGQAYETMDTTVLARSVDRGEVLKAVDVTIERRPKSESGNDIASREAAIGMQMRKAVRAGQILRNADVAKPDLVQRDQSVSIIYQAPGLQLTMLGKAVENGAEGDAVSVMNITSKRVVQGTVVGPGRVLVTPPGFPVTASAATPATATSSSE
jgi:flagella basal body P-ring formation protein FlgA